MLTVFKYPIPGRPNAFGDFTLTLPKGAVVLHIAPQDGKRCLWAEVERDEEMMIPREFRIVSTGGDVIEEAHHVATWQEPPFVWHLYEVEAPDAE